MISGPLVPNFGLRRVGFARQQRVARFGQSVRGLFKRKVLGRSLLPIMARRTFVMARRHGQS